MSVEFKRTENSLIVDIGGEIDHHSAKMIRTQIDSEIIYEKTEKVIMDLSKTTFMDSSGLGLVLGRFRKLNDMGIDLEVINPNIKIYKILCMEGVDKLVKIKGVGIV